MAAKKSITKKPAKTKNTRQTVSIRVGFGMRDVTPPLPFPLAGYAHKHERLATKVRDPLTARAVAFGDGKTTAVVAAIDLLLTSVPLREAVLEKVRQEGVSLDGLLLSATHSHSSVGAFVDRPSAKSFMGNYRPAIFDRLVKGVAGAIVEAVNDLQPAKLSFGETETTNLNWNRRHVDGYVDRKLAVLTAERDDANVHIVSFGAHPVVVGERDHYLASADYPGELRKTIEAKGDKAMFVVGPVGGVNVLFPEGPMDVEVHLKLLARLLREELDKAEANRQSIKVAAGVGFGLGETRIDVGCPQLLPSRLAWADALLMPLRMWVRRFGRKALFDGQNTQVPAVRVGDVIFTGFPADVGAGIGLAARRLIEEQGYRVGSVASHTNDFIGYIHMPDDYERFETENKAAMWMTIYENAMAFPGRQTGEELVEACRRAVVAAK